MADEAALPSSARRSSPKRSGKGSLGRRAAADGSQARKNGSRRKPVKAGSSHGSRGSARKRSAGRRKTEESVPVGNGNKNSLSRRQGKKQSLSMRKQKSLVDNEAAAAAAAGTGDAGAGVEPDDFGPRDAKPTTEGRTKSLKDHPMAATTRTVVDRKPSDMSSDCSDDELTKEEKERARKEARSSMQVKPGTRAKALFDWVGDEAAGELSFAHGSTIRLLERSEDGWWKGEVGGEVGVFPRHYVDDLEAAPEEPRKPESAAAASISASSSAKKEGYLTKRGHVVKNWKSRWFVLKGDTLYYFKSPDEVLSTGTIPLTGAKLKMEDHVSTKFPKPNCFSLTVTRPGTKKLKVYVIQAPTIQIRDEWLDEIRDVMHSLS